MKKIRTIWILIFAAFLCWPITAFAAGQERLIRVIDFASRHGVKSEIFRRSAAGIEISLGDTDAQGEKKIPAAGSNGERLHAVPRSPRYYDNSADCPLPVGKTVVEVYAIDSIGGTGQRMLMAARDAETAGKKAEAALEFKKLALYAAKKNDPVLARLFEKRVLDLGGEMLDVPSPAQPRTDPGSWAATPRLRNEVRNFQRELNVPTTGALDVQTLAKAAERERNSAQPKKTMTTRP